MFVPLEHHVLEEMGKTASPVWVILGTDVIPDLDGNGWALVIFDGVDLQAVLKRRMFESKRRNRDRLRRRRTLGTGTSQHEENDGYGGNNGEFHEVGYPT